MVTFLLTPVFAQASESNKFWQEFDITFWQTLPFATLWGYFIDRQLSSLILPGSAAHWQAILPFAAFVSAGNAFIHARKVMNERTRNHN